MALTKAEQRQLAALQAKADAPDDAPRARKRSSSGADEGGVYVLTGRHASDFVRSFYPSDEADAFEADGDDQDDEEDQADDDEDDDEDDDAAPPDPPASHGHRYFSGRGA